MQTSSWIDALEDRFGHWAVPNLTRIIVGMNILAWLLEQFSPGFTGMLVLDAQAVMSGEVWRLVTFLFIPASTRSPLFILLFFYVTWLIGEYLESEWGAFKVNLYYLLGWLALAIVCFFVVHGKVDNVYLNSSLFMALGTVIPEMVFYVYFVLPVKAKFLAWLTAGMLALAAFFGEGQFFIVLASVANYLLFFGPAYIQGKKEEAGARERRRRFQSRD
jgi:hypothetical protein